MYVISPARRHPRLPILTPTGTYPRSYRRLPPTNKTALYTRERFFVKNATTFPTNSFSACRSRTSFSSCFTLIFSLSVRAGSSPDVPPDTRTPNSPTFAISDHSHKQHPGSATTSQPLPKQQPPETIRQLSLRGSVRKGVHRCSRSSHGVRASVGRRKTRKS